MSKKIDVAHVARLARIAMSDEARRHFEGQLERIVEYVDKLQQVDVSDVPPMAHAISRHNVFRKDEPRPSLTNEQALANAPDRVKGFFKVPAIIEEE